MPGLPRLPKPQVHHKVDSPNTGLFRECSPDLQNGVIEQVERLHRIGGPPLVNRNSAQREVPCGHPKPASALRRERALFVVHPTDEPADSGLPPPPGRSSVAKGRPNTNPPKGMHQRDA